MPSLLQGFSSLADHSTWLALVAANTQAAVSSVRVVLSETTGDLAFFAQTNVGTVAFALPVQDVQGFVDTIGALDLELVPDEQVREEVPSYDDSDEDLD